MSNKDSRRNRRKRHVKHEDEESQSSGPPGPEGRILDAEKSFDNPNAIFDPTENNLDFICYRSWEAGDFSAAGEMHKRKSPNQLRDGERLAFTRWLKTQTNFIEVYRNTWNLGFEEETLRVIDDMVKEFTFVCKQQEVENYIRMADNFGRKARIYVRNRYKRKAEEEQEASSLN